MKIGNITLRYGICLAPLAGVSDRPFRRVAREFGAEYTVSEMVSAKALCYEQNCRRAPIGNRVRTAPLAAVMRDEYPMAVQLFGAEPDFVARAASRNRYQYGVSDGQNRRERGGERPHA